MTFLNTASDLEPSWMVPWGLIVVCLLLAILIAIAVWPIRDADQPRFPS
jgi:hypothetical protein